jgi:uncharacterized membrane protein YoaK (UPF0700 family)
MNEPSRSRVQGVGLGFLAGYVDTLGFIALFGLFTAHVTGNFILIGASLAQGGQASILLKLLAFPAFIAGVAVARVVVAMIEARRGPALRWALALELALLAGFMGCGLAASPVVHQGEPLAMIAGLLGAAAMGAHSAISRLLLGHLAPTSMMTGNVTQIVIDSVDCLRGAADPGLGQRFAKFIWPLLAFAIGCVAAAFAFQAFGFVALTVPLVILVALIALEPPVAPA